MKDRTTAYLRQRRKKLIEKLESTQFKIIRGSLIEKYKRCGKPRCRCVEGQGHGPKYYLSTSYPGRRPEIEYVPKDYVKEVEHFLMNYKEARQIMEEISKINREILSRRQRL